MLTAIVCAATCCIIMFVINFFVHRFYVQFNRDGHVPGSRLVALLAGFVPFLFLARFCEVVLAADAYPLAFAYMAICGIAGLIYGLVCGKAALRKSGHRS